MGTWGRKLSVVFCGLIFGITSIASTEVLYEHSSNGSPIFQLIESATQSIDIEIYSLEDLRVQDLVIAAMNRGVKVRIVQEPKPLGTSCYVFEKVSSDDSYGCQMNKRFVQKVKKLGGGYVPFATAALCTSRSCYEHGKMMIVDQRFAMLSTGNFNPTSFCNPAGSADGQLSRCNRDYSVVTSDKSAVSVLLAVFNSDFLGKTYDLSKTLSQKAAQRLTVSPYSLNPILQFVNSAKQSILIEHQYLLNDDLNNALMAAAKRGVKVYIVLASACAFGQPTKEQAHAASLDYKKFDAAGVKLRMFSKSLSVNGYGGYLHAKTIVVDGAKAWVGSVNGSTQALTLNREFGIFFNDPQQVSRLVNYIVSDFNHPNSESWQESLVCKKD